MPDTLKGVEMNEAIIQRESWRFGLYIQAVANQFNRVNIIAGQSISEAIVQQWCDFTIRRILSIIWFLL